jgi:hypothetical protein
MPDSKPKPEEEEGSVTKVLGTLGELGKGAAQEFTGALSSGADTLSDIYQKLREETGEVLSYNPQQDEYPHGFIQGGNISFYTDPQDPNNPYQAHITYEKGKPGELVRIGQDYKGPLTVRPKSDKQFAYEHGYEGKSIVEITDIPRGIDGKPTGVVVLDSDDELMFIPKESLGRVPSAQTLLRQMKEEAQAEEQESDEPAEVRRPTLQEAFGYLDTPLELTAAANHPFYQFMREEAEAREDELQELRAAKQGEAIGYAYTAGPYEGQDLSDEQIFEASAIDFGNAQENYDEALKHEFDGVEVTGFDDGSVFMDAGEGVINVTGHPAYDPNHEDYSGPPVDKEG